MAEEGRMKPLLAGLSREARETGTYRVIVGVANKSRVLKANQKNLALMYQDTIVDS